MMTNKRTLSLGLVAVFSAGVLGLTLRYPAFSGRESSEANRVEDSHGEEEAMRNSVETAESRVREPTLISKVPGVSINEAPSNPPPIIYVPQNDLGTSSRDAQRRADALMSNAEKRREVTAKDAEKIVALQCLMAEAELDVSVARFHELLNSPNVDTSGL